MKDRIYWEIEVVYVQKSDIYKMRNRCEAV